ncbi:recombinase family protein [Microvirga sp. VF16]|uniref:recombinase family protein n=1 Tax=Microvirga sp. VF16 TaxID=2807101 RepID=UPI001FEE7182|nr:recombinase family protein [Microvirga sp. VF16]
MFDHRIALYARVSTEQQVRDHTIASQLAALHERIAADEQALAPEDAYVMRATAAPSWSVRAWSACGMRSPPERSSGCMFSLRIGWRAAMPIRCS